MRAVGVTLACLLLFCSGAGAQPQDRDAVPAVTSLQNGAQVMVTTTDGNHVEGRVLGSSPEGIRLRAGRTERFVPLERIRIIETRDPLRDGIRRGAAWGALSAGGTYALFAVAGRCRSNCGPHYVRNEVVSALEWAAAGAAAGALAGLVVDALFVHRRTLYPAPLAARPALNGRPGGAAITIAWRW